MKDSLAVRNAKTALVEQTLINSLLNDCLPSELLDNNATLEERVEAIINSSLVPFFHDKLSENINISHMDQVEEAYARHCKKILHAIEVLDKLQKEIDQRGIKAVLIKGLAFSSSIYGNLFSRQCDDIDILVHESDAFKIDLVLREIGFVQPGSHRKVHRQNSAAALAVDATTTPFPVKRHSHSTQFSPYYTCGNSGVKLELHWGINDFSDDQLSFIFWNTEEKVFGNTIVKVPNEEATFVLLVANCFENNLTLFGNSPSSHLSMRDYYDLHIYFKSRKSCNSVFWNIVAEHCRTLGFTDQLSLVLYEYSSVFGEKMLVPKELAEFIIQGKKMFPSYWSLSFLDRYTNKTARHDEWRRRTKQLVVDLSQKSQSSPVLVRYYEPINWSIIQRPSLPHGLMFALTIFEKNLSISWRIPSVLLPTIENYIFQLQFFNAAASSEWLEDIVDVFFAEGKWLFRHEVCDRIVNGASNKIDEHTRLCEIEKMPKYTDITSKSIYIEAFEESLRSYEMYIVPNVFKRHHDRFFHLIDGGQESFYRGRKALCIDSKPEIL